MTFGSPLRLISLAVLATLSLGQWASAQRGAPVQFRSRVLPNPAEYGAAGLFQFQPESAIPKPPALPAGADLPRILLTGYWPPSNEAIRRFSTDPVLNPNGWIGADWEGRGYDVYSYFPSFVPRNCDNCGQGSGDFEVDYQDTSADWWRIVEEVKPIAIITLSRGFIDFSWELEMNQYNRSTWFDDFTAPFQPTPAPPDSGAPADSVRNSSLPVQAIVDAIDNANLGLNAFICWAGDGGGFLSEFMAYHGVWSKELNESPADPDWCIAAGHIHVGGLIDWPTVRNALRVSLREVIKYTDTVRAGTECQADLGFGGPGVSSLQVCGDALSRGNSADFMLSGAPPNTAAFLLASTSMNPTPFKGGLLLPLPIDLLRLMTTDAEGRVFIPNLPGGNGPLSVFAQFVCVDPAEPLGFGISNAVQIDFLQ